MKKRILITGSSGMLGTALCYRCLKTYELYGTDITKPEVLINGLNSFNIDITDKIKIIELIKKIKPDVVIHAAAYADVDYSEKDEAKVININGNGTRNVALGCKETGALLFYISTDFVFDGKKSTAYVEDDVPSPVNVYGKSKLKGEKAVKEILDKFVIVRTSWLFGRYGKNFVDTVLEIAENEKELKVVSDQTGSPTYTKDLAEAVVELINNFIDKKESIICHITNSGSVSWDNYAKEILKYAGIKGVKVLPITSEESSRLAKRPKMSLLDNSRYERITGHKLRNYKEALKDYILKGRMR